MKTFPALYSAELIKEIHHQAHLFKITAASTYYWTDCDQDIHFDGHLWQRKNIKFDAAQFSIDARVDTITLELENIDKSISDWVLSENIQGKEIRIYRVMLDANLDPIGVSAETDLSPLFVGYLDQMTIDRRRARIQVYNHFIKWKMTVPKRFHSPNCQWLFKGTECTYAGASTECNKTWNNCTTLSNTLNFGGFRHLPDLQAKEIMWGKIAKNWHK